MAKDLVCDMDVDEKTAKWKTIYQGKTYYFCAPGCKKQFEATHRNMSATARLLGTPTVAAAADTKPKKL